MVVDNRVLSIIGSYLAVSFFFSCSLSMKMDLNIILMSAEELFFKYCRKSVIDCFQVVDMETVS